MSVVVLTPDELAQGIAVASRRRISCIFGRKTAQHYDDKNGEEWSTEIESACAEIAVCKHYNQYWTGGVFSGSRADFDAGQGRQVRHTVFANGHLLVYAEDKDEDAIVLVTGKAPEYCLAGWLYAHEAKANESWWRTDARCPCWWVPQNSLRQVRPLR